MHPTKALRVPLALLAAALATLVITAGCELDTDAAATPSSPNAKTETGVVRGAAVTGGYQFLGIPYAAAPTGNLRWRPPQPAPSWKGVRDASQFGPSCPQPETPFAPPGVQSEDCLRLNVYTPALSSGRAKARPVLVWIHGGGFVQDGARNYDPKNLAAEGTVVVTVNYRLGALGFLAHPALASSPGGPSGNYGLMDQQAALRWVQHNIRTFGGDPNNVTIAGESAGGLSVLMHMVSEGSRGLFQKAIVQSGSFAMTQLPHSDGGGLRSVRRRYRWLRRSDRSVPAQQAGGQRWWGASRRRRSLVRSTVRSSQSRSELRSPRAGSPGSRSSTG